MVQDCSASLSAVFRALSDPTRREILRSLVGREHSITELAEPFAMSFAGASKHLRALESAGLVSRRIEGREHIFRLEARRLATAHQWLSFYERLWNERLDRLEAHLKRKEGR